jgi:hypothetical protein
MRVKGISYPTGGYGAFGRGAISAPLPHNCRHALRTWVTLPVLFPNSVDFGAQSGIALLTGSALAAGEERFGELPPIQSDHRKSGYRFLAKPGCGWQTETGLLSDDAIAQNNPFANGAVQTGQHQAAGCLWPR